MTADTITAQPPRLETPSPPTGTVLTTAEYASLVQELERLRSRHRAELEERLRDARAFGVSSDNDDLLAAMEDATIDKARIAQLADELRNAHVVDAASMPAGTAGLGATVRVVDDAGRYSEYDLVGRRTLGSGRQEVTSSSPVGGALMGARAGDELRVDLPSGRVRMLRVLDVCRAGSVH